MAYPSVRIEHHPAAESMQPPLLCAVELFTCGHEKTVVGDGGKAEVEGTVPIEKGDDESPPPLILAHYGRCPLRDASLNPPADIPKRRVAVVVL
eukprot:gene23435-35396_t